MEEELRRNEFVPAVQILHWKKGPSLVRCSLLRRGNPRELRNMSLYLWKGEAGSFRSQPTVVQVRKLECEGLPFEGVRKAGEGLRKLE